MKTCFITNFNNCDIKFFFYLKSLLCPLFSEII